MLKEKPVYVRPWREFIFRADPDEVNEFHLLVTQYGQPFPNQTVNLFPTPWRQWSEGPREPENGVTYESSAPTNDNGIATFNLHAHNVGEPRKEFYIDGQVYRYSYNVTGYPDAADKIDISGFIEETTSGGQQTLTRINDVAILVFSNVSYPADKRQINWVDHVAPIFSQYSQLFPVMQRILNMSNYTNVKQKTLPLQYALSLDINHPTYMPVTRDLSKAKRDMILAWFDNGCRYSSTHKDGPNSEYQQCKPFSVGTKTYAVDLPVPLPESCQKGLKPHKVPADIRGSAVQRLSYPRNKQTMRAFGYPLEAEFDCMDADWQRMSFKKERAIDDLRCLLQTAIRLEFATLPPYLTALFSIIDGCNYEVEERILSVAMQEMLHFALASNLLIALGGHPIINSPNFAPKYPGNLPGGVLPGLTVHLRRATRHHIRYNFMAIEFPTETRVDEDPPVYHNNTIGDFYKFINDTLNELYKREGEHIFCQECFKNEISWPAAPGTLYNVTNITTAHLAINEIVEQGEGVGPFDPSSGLGDQLAHYYKFEEIVCGNQLINTSDGYKFSGDPIVLDENGVYPMEDDPRTGSLTPNTNAMHYSRVFNEMYRNLLNRLHKVLNGEPDGFGDAVALMQSIKVHAKKLLQTPTHDGFTAGPAWEYEPIKL